MWNLISSAAATYDDLTNQGQDFTKAYGPTSQTQNKGSAASGRLLDKVVFKVFVSKGISIRAIPEEKKSWGGGDQSLEHFLTQTLPILK